MALKVAFLLFDPNPPIQIQRNVMIRPSLHDNTLAVASPGYLAVSSQGNRDRFGASLCVMTSWVLLALLFGASTGCQLHLNSWAGDSIPANRLDPNLFGCSRDGMKPTPQNMLSQPPSAEHLIDADDVLSVYVYGVFPPRPDDTPTITQQQGLNQRYYPPHGSVVAPATGLPIKVEAGGILDLPLIAPLVLRGLTTQQATEAIRNAYHEMDVIVESHARITVSIIIPRTKRIIVLREDAADSRMSVGSASSVEQTHRGSGQIIDLPIYENDVLHALTASGGLPGSDAANEAFIVRASGGWTEQFLQVENPLDAVLEGSGMGVPVESFGNAVVRIPLSIRNGESITFGPSDVILHEGDVLFIPRRREYYYTGGLLSGGRVPLPRDEDLDIVEAISMIGASPGGPMGKDGTSLASGRHTILRSATRAIVLRKLPDGRQLNIRVDLDRAMHDPKERLRIQPDDVVMLYQKPTAAVLNAVLNIGAR